MKAKKVHMRNEASFLAGRETSHHHEQIVSLTRSLFVGAFKSRFMSVWGRWGYLKSTGLSIIAGTVQRGQGLKGVSFFMGRHSGRVISHPWHWFFLCHWSSYLTSLWYWAESLWGPETVCWTLCCRKRPWFCVQVAKDMNTRKRCIWVLSALGHLVHSQMFVILPTIR